MRVDVGQFDGLAAADAGEVLRPCCASSRWVAELTDGRPYGSFARLSAASDVSIAGLKWTDLEEALAAHPRIGERATGSDKEAAFSREEQADTSEVKQQLLAGNRAYEERFGHVFLICATGKSPADMLAALQQRLTNDPGSEREVVRIELTEIVRIRLAKTFA